MSVTVRIPTIMRPLTGGASEVAAAGSTLGEVVHALEAEHPGVGGRLLDDGGNLRRFVNVYVGDEDVRFAGGLETPTPDGTTVSIIPAVAGGCGWPDGPDRLAAEPGRLRTAGRGLYRPSRS